MPAKPIPEGYHTVTPYLLVDGAAEAIEFYKKAFDATEKLRLPGPEGKVMHAEIQIGDSRVMLSDEFEALDAFGPKTRGGTTVPFCIYVENVDAKYAQALAAGGRETRPLQDQFYGDRSGTFEDPFGHQWTIATHIEDLTNEEISKRMSAMGQG